MGLLGPVLLLWGVLGLVHSWNQGSVLLRDIQALTLYKDRYTTARRSAPVPQLKCVGGSAGCQAFVPEVVQCLNRGWDGDDVQWECKTEMDALYRFGRVEVSCEGYSHPEDPLVLQGSCGLEFTLERTEEGRRRGGGHSASGLGGLGGMFSSFFSGSSGNHQSPQSQSSQGSGDLLGLVLLLLGAYAIYKLFLSRNTEQREQEGPPRDTHHSTAGPPPPGFKPDFTGYPSDDPGSSGPSHRQQGPGGWGAAAGSGGWGAAAGPGGWGRAAGPGGGGFWTGMGTGGVLGYLFGQRNRSYNHHNYTSYSAPPPANPHSSSSGTRTASGFGGTKRR